VEEDEVKRMIIIPDVPFKLKAFSIRGSTALHEPDRFCEFNGTSGKVSGSSSMSLKWQNK
jgi:hypothetical protein